MIKATFDNVIVKVIYKDTSGVIVIPDVLKKRLASFQGEVISVGPDFRYDVKVGDTVVFPRDEGFLVITDDGDCVSLRSRWVLAVLKE